MTAARDAYAMSHWLVVVDTRSQHVAQSQAQCRRTYLLLQPTDNETDGSGGKPL